MRQPSKREEMPDELVLALGLVWGHLNARQFEQAYTLARGCLRVWPHDRGLNLMHAYAAAEMLEPVNHSMLNSMATADCKEWIELVLCRSRGAAAAE